MPIFVNMVVPVKTQVENGIRKIFNFRGQTIDVSDQAFFTLKDSGIHDEELGSRYGWNQRFHKQKAQFLQINSAGNFKRRIRLHQKVGSLCALFVDIGGPVETQVENGISKLFDFWGQTIDVSDQAFFTLKDLVIHDE